MSRTSIIAVVTGLVLVAAAAWFLLRGRSTEHVVDLLAAYPQADKRSNHQPVESAFALESVTIDGQTKPCILARSAARVTFTVAVPADGWLETSFAIKPEAWTQPTDGAQFRIGVSDGRTYDELLRQVVRPDRGDKRWFPVRLDLSAYEGHTVRVIFNTDPGPPGDTDNRFDEAVWCEPRISSHR